ncbi:MAG: hypothetical protein IKO25_03255 [Clostridia bacterium]|nr:hypothetical protein [Clostridia bacterium]
MRNPARQFLILLLCIVLTGTCTISFAEGTEDAGTLPETFDLRQVDTDGDGVGDRCYVPPVRQQNPFMTCWGFAATAASEISILGSILDYDPDAWKTIDLSEKQLAYFAHMPLEDANNPQNGEGISVSRKDALSVYNTGGSLFLAASAYAQGIGPSKEDNGEYGDLFRYYGREKNTLQRYIGGAYRNFSYSDMDDWSIPEEYRFARDYYLTESVLLPSPAQHSLTVPYEYNPDANRMIKEQLLLKRGVSIGFLADVSRPDQDLAENGVYLNNVTWAHYTWENLQANHGVTIIGWDDNYPKENFLPEHQPPENGAWLVRNSWGSGEEEFPNCGEMNWGIPVQKKDADGNPVFDENGEPVMVGSGYFWLSYFDQTLTNPESFVFEDSFAPEYIDQHDYLPVGEVVCEKYEKPVKMANVFIGGHSRVLTEISCMTGSANTEANYSIYLLCNDFTSPEEGLCVCSGSARFEYAGYHRIRLENEVFIQNGQAYAIVLEMTDPEGCYLTNEAVLCSIPGVLPTNPVAVINKNESFLFRDGAWEDYRETALRNAENNMEIKAIPGGQAVCDNFAIKGYCNYIAGDIAMVPSVLAEKALVAMEGYNTTKIKLFFRGSSWMEMGNPDIEWTLLNGSEEIADFVTQKEGSQILLTARKEGKIYLAIRIRGQESMGTTILRLAVEKAVPSSVFAETYENVYTGEPITPRCIVRSSQGVILTEGTDYAVEYGNNIRCGDADIVVRPAGREDGAISGHFMIVPGKAEISGVNEGDGMVRVTVADQWATGISGYEIEYRKAGEGKWQTVILADGKTEAVLSGLEAGAACEVRARATVEGLNAIIAVPMTYYGEYSEPVAFTAP